MDKQELKENVLNHADKSLGIFADKSTPEYLRELRKRRDLLEKEDIESENIIALMTSILDYVGEEVVRHENFIRLLTKNLLDKKTFGEIDHD